MAVVRTTGSRFAGVVTCVPGRRFDNLRDTTGFSPEEVRKVTGMAGVASRRLAGDELCSSDLSAAAGRRLLDALGWAPESVDALVFVTQTPDFFLPSTALVVHRELGLGTGCAAFDVGLGCSGYPYGLWLGAMMIQTGGVRRALVMHGETPTRFIDAGDRSVALLFGDAGSATALEADPAGGSPWDFVLHSDGAGVDAMIIEAGGFRDRFSDDTRKHSVVMDGAAVFNFTIRTVPALVSETLSAAGLDRDGIDYFVFHQSNQFIIRHLCAKSSIPPEKAPLTIREFGNTGGVSIPLTLTEGGLERPPGRALKLMLLGYGVGLSWGSAVVDLPPGAVLETIELDGPSEKSA
jgi:3-oxoacyl-[acyl-carrier-protein] synthase-3